MIKRLALTTALLAGATGAAADPGLFLGLAYTFGASGGGGPGLTLKVTSTKKEHHGALAAGVTYYPLDASNPFGVDVGVGYLFDNAAVTVGWDFLHSPQISAGWIDTDDGKSAPAGGGGGGGGG